jgi:hypothetical protein
MLLLRRMKPIDNTLGVSQFCCGIYQFIVSNMKKFVGVCPDGNDAMFQYPWGQMSCLKKKSCNQTTSCRRLMTTKVMSGIWSERVDYSSPVSKAHWMDSAYLFPVIAYKYKIRQLVLYNNSATHTNCVDGGCCFTTYVYCYDESKCYVSTKTIPGLEGPVAKVPFSQMVQISLLSGLIYSTRCEYDILKVLFLKNDWNLFC